VHLMTKCVFQMLELLAAHLLENCGRFWLGLLYRPETDVLAPRCRTIADACFVRVPICDDGLHSRSQSSQNTTNEHLWQTAGKDGWYDFQCMDMFSNNIDPPITRLPSHGRALHRLYKC
jgi:hypothetical protein